ncbi:MAG: helix-turn-helix domain-containing protein [Planctomycetota bacterium]
MAKSFVAIEHDDEHVPTITLGRHQKRAQDETAVDGQVTDGGGAIPGGFSQLFNKVISSLAYAALPEAAKLVYPALVWMADHRRQFVIENRGYGEISKYAGVSRSTAQKGIAKLTEAGLVRLARPARRTASGGLTANVYQLLVPIDGLDLEDDTHTATRATPVPRRGTAPTHQPVHTSTAPRHTPVPPTGRNTKKTKKKNSKTAKRAAAVGEGVKEVQAMLIERGVGDPLLSRVLDTAEPAFIRQHILDFDLRNKLPRSARKSPGWLVQSILVPYDLHEKTIAQLEVEQRQKRGNAQRRRKQLTDALEQERANRVDAWVEEEFASMADDELAAWHRKVLDQHPRLTRGLTNADPRTNAKLTRLIKAALSSLYVETE